MTPFQAPVEDVHALTPRVAVAAIELAQWEVATMRMRSGALPLGTCASASTTRKATGRHPPRRAWNGPFVVDDGVGVQLHSLPQGGYASFEAARQDEFAPHAHIRSLPPQGGHASFETARQEAS